MARRLDSQPSQVRMRRGNWCSSTGHLPAHLLDAGRALEIFSCVLTGDEGRAFSSRASCSRASERSSRGVGFRAAMRIPPQRARSSACRRSKRGRPSNLRHVSEETPGCRAHAVRAGDACRAGRKEGGPLAGARRSCPSARTGWPACSPASRSDAGVRDNERRRALTLLIIEPRMGGRLSPVKLKGSSRRRKHPSRRRQHEFASSSRVKTVVVVVVLIIPKGRAGEPKDPRPARGWNPGN